MNTSVSPSSMDLDSEQHVLRDEVDAVVSRFMQTTEQMLQQVESELLQRADDAVNSRERQLLTDAYIHLRKKRGELQSRFQQILGNLINDMKNPKNDVISFDQINLDELQLVDISKVDEDVQISNFANKIKMATESELRDLNARINFVYGKEGVDDEQNPLRPELFCRALSQACETLETDHQSRIQIMRAFERSLSENISNTYKNLNERLIARNILPSIRFSSIKKALPPRRQPLLPEPPTDVNDLEGADLNGMQGILGGIQGGSEDMAGDAQDPFHVFGAAVENTITMFEALQNMVARSSRFQDTASKAPITNPTGSRRNLFSTIQRLNQTIELQEGLMASNELAANVLVNENLKLLQPITNQIWQHREQLAAAAPNHLDRVTIDVVAMLFDEILADDKVPSNIKSVIGRLQLPILKTALSDSTFFATRSHPARRLIDRIASCAIGYSPEHDPDSHFYNHVVNMVDTIIQESAENPEIFVTLLNEFEHFLSEEQRQQNDIVDRAANILEHAEMREIVGINATIQVRQILEKTELNDFLKEFLLDVWSQVMAEAACRTNDPANDPLSKQLKQICIDLVWSAQPKIEQDDRRRLVQMLPSMIRQIREGFSLISYPSDKATYFFSQLMQVHSNAVKTNMLGTTPMPTTDIDHFAAALERMVLLNDLPTIAPGALNVDVKIAEQLIEEEKVPVAMVSTKEDAPANINVDQATLDNWLDSLERGNWLLLRENNEWQKIRLAWISPLKSFYLFSSQNNQQGHSMSANVLKQSFACGKLRFAEESLLVDRAVRSMMTNLAQPKTTAEATQ